ncbi:MAG: hypothetical protein AUF76_06785 [Acidobacteria bacterium 13_1_20CM_2_65_9]|nr:MAG: hypothetical protein AUF76_06785 [Acidobacteria bacterium 13_1_20CM_2_65_9]
MNSIVVHVVLLLLLVAQTVFAQTTKNTQLADMVTRMAKIGRASSPTFSPDGTRLAFVSAILTPRRSVHDGPAEAGHYVLRRRIHPGPAKAGHYVLLRFGHRGVWSAALKGPPIAGLTSLRQGFGGPP